MNVEPESSPQIMSDPFYKKRPRNLEDPPHSSALSERRIVISSQIDGIDWNSFTTAYNAPETVPLDLTLLLFGSEKQSLDASHRLWCGLCHQHAYMSSAAEPALSFLLEALRLSNDLIKIEILDIMLGFALCSGPGSVRADPKNALDFPVRVRYVLHSELQLFEELSKSNNEEVADFADAVLEELQESRAEQKNSANGKSRTAD